MSVRALEAAPMIRRYHFSLDTGEHAYHERVYRLRGEYLENDMTIRAHTPDAVDDSTAIDAISIGFDASVLRDDRRDSVRFALADFLAAFAPAEDAAVYAQLIRSLRAADTTIAVADSTRCDTMQLKQDPMRSYRTLMGGCSDYEEPQGASALWIVNLRGATVIARVVQITKRPTHASIPDVRGWLRLPEPWLIGATVQEYEHSAWAVAVNLVNAVRTDSSVDYFEDRGRMRDSPPPVHLALDAAGKITSVTRVEEAFVEPGLDSYRFVVAAMAAEGLAEPHLRGWTDSDSVRALITSVVNGPRATAVIDLKDMSLRFDTVPKAGVRVMLGQRGAFGPADLTVDAPMPAFRY